MPISLVPAQTRSGHFYLRTVSTGEVNAADAVKLNEAISPDGKWPDLPILGLVESGASFSSEARQALTAGKTSTGQGTKPVAIVVTNAPLRVMLSFVIRISGAVESTRFFSTEAHALGWLDDISVARLGLPA